MVLTQRKKTSTSPGSLAVQICWYQGQGIQTLSWGLIETSLTFMWSYLQHPYALILISLSQYTNHLNASKNSISLDIILHCSMTWQQSAWKVTMDKGKQATSNSILLWTHIEYQSNPQETASLLSWLLQGRRNLLSMISSWDGWRVLYCQGFSMRLGRFHWIYLHSWPHMCYQIHRNENNHKSTSGAAGSKTAATRCWNAWGEPGRTFRESSGARWS